jgi:UPF0755 protein
MNVGRKSKIANFCVGFFAAVLSVVLFLGYSLKKKSSYVAERNVIIERTGDDDFLRLLIDKKISNNPMIAKISIKIMELFGYRIKFGEYVLPNQVSLFEAIRIFSSGKVVIHKITIPEGFSVLQVIRRLEKNEDLIGEIERVPKEGSLMPDTYCFKYPTKKQDIIVMAQKAMAEFIRREWPKRSPKCSLKSPREALTLASIVEKETNIEKEAVAGLYLHRLKIDMKLQADPTTIYAHKKGDKLGRNLLYSDLKIDNPYNTYVYKGLPPTPIANPGRASILATLRPEETDNLYFVYGGEGKHIFAKTYDEHKRNIAKATIFRNTAFPRKRRHLTY